MNEFVAKLREKTGIDEATANKVVAFIKDHADEIPKLIGSSGLADKLPSGVGNAAKNFLSGDK